jgi:maleylacetoacetate isomerase
MTAPALVLHGYWRSSAAYRVRIGLGLKGLVWQDRPVHLVRDGGEQHGAAHVALNPQQLVPVLEHAGRVLTQSLAILEYLDEAFPGTPALLPADPAGRAQVRALAQLIACDVHPLNNLRVMQYLGRELAADEAARARWTAHWMEEGFAAMETLLAQRSPPGTSVMATAPGRLIAAWSRSSTTPVASGWTWAATRACCRSSRPAWPCRPLLRPRPRPSPTR